MVVVVQMQEARVHPDQALRQQPLEAAREVVDVDRHVLAQLSGQ